MSENAANNSSSVRMDKELEEFRNLMQPPSTFEDGFTWPAFFGALFVSLVMVPGAIYMSLIAGQSIGPAAQWVTVILFIEVARRANRSLRKAEIFTLFYLAGAALATPFSGILWHQYYAQFSAAQSLGITVYLPIWYSPTDPEVLQQRSLLQWEWLPALGLVMFSTIMARLDNSVLGYGLFRLASDIERLPFPMAPLGAQGILALSEEQEEERKGGREQKDDVSEEEPEARSWRWRVFSVGAVLGLTFGSIYLLLPTVTGALLDQPISLLPIPWIDYTPTTAKWLPAVATGLSFDLGQLIIGMVLPFYAMLGSFIGLVVTFILNPVLYHADILDNWSPQNGTIETMYLNNLDFYFSFTIGISLAIAVVGLWAVVKGFRRLRMKRREDEERGIHHDEIYAAPEGRGDIPFKFIFIVYFATTLIYIVVSGFLINWHAGVMGVMFFYGFVYTPLISYATARLEGIAGQVVNIPFVKEASFILSGYKGVAVWFLPIPLHDYGARTVFYRKAELTGTKFWSIWKSEILLTPIVIICSLVFAHVIWQLAPIPGPQYPYAQKMWELQAENMSIVYSSTLGGYSRFEEAWKPTYFGIGLVGGIATFASMSWLGAPTFLVYGVVRGLGQTEPHIVFPQFIGALLGKFYFQRKLGLKWRQYIPVVAAGFACGMGLIGTVGIGITFLIKSVFQLPY